jgi:multiple sugar transport system substrate-binding protein
MQFIREDIWADAGEQAAFLERYGYPLKYADTWDEVRDQIEFFTRSAGETLMGETLESNFWGTAQMGGRFTHVQDEIAGRLWGIGGNFLTPMRDGAGNITEWVYTQENRAAVEKVSAEWVRDMEFSSPGSLNAFWDYTCTQYTGGFFFGAVRGAANLEAVYWLSRYLSSYDAQLQMPQAGGWPISRFDVVDEARSTLSAADFHFSFGYVDVQMETAIAQLPDLEEYIHFNSAAAGKIYDLMTDVFHENAIGNRTPKETADFWGREVVRLQNEYGKGIGAREE